MIKKILIIGICLLLSNVAVAENVGKISVTGNMRIEIETVKSYMKLSEGDSFDPAKLDASIKSLFATGLFSDVSIDIDGDDLVVRVIENPIVNQVVFEGNDRMEDETLLSEITLKPRTVYTTAKAKKDNQRIIDIYKRSGRYSVTVEPSIIKREYNRVDLIFKIDEGKQTYISVINFVGNNKFSSKKLQEELLSKEERWYRFFSQSTTYDPDRVNYDKELIRKFYLNKGYYDIAVTTTIAELTKDEDSFFITFRLDEGIRYKFGKTTIINHIPHANPDMNLEKEINIEDGDWFDQSILDINLQNINNKLGEYGYAFVDINPVISKTVDGKLDISFIINESPKVYINKINIQNNSRTVDKVIRREFKVEEGDAFNVLKIKKSKQNIEDLDFFSKVDINTKPSSEAPDKVDINVDVEEKPTGSMTFSVGYSTDDGPLTEIGVKESNLLGKAYVIGAKASVSADTTGFDLSFADPYFLDKNLYFYNNIFYTTDDRTDESSYEIKTAGYTTRLAWDYTERLRHMVKYTIKHEEFFNIKSTASYYVKQVKPEAVLSMPGHMLSYDTRDSKINPSTGYYLTFGNDFAGLGGDYTFLRTDVSGTYYYPLSDDVVLASYLGGGYVWGKSGDVPINHRYFLGGDSLRGFERSGIGARDRASDDALGGIWEVTGKFQVTSPIGFPEEVGIKGKVFLDAGTLGKPLQNVPDDILYDSSLRASFGVGILWMSPMGPINMDFGHAFLKQEYDKTEIFRLSFSTGL